MVKGEQFKNHKYVENQPTFCIFSMICRLMKSPWLILLWLDLRDEASIEALELILSDSFRRSGYGGVFVLKPSIDWPKEELKNLYLNRRRDDDKPADVAKYGKMAHCRISLEYGPKPLSLPQALAQLPDCQKTIWRNISSICACRG